MISDKTDFDTANSEFLTFLESSPTPYHATHNLAEIFAKAGFKRLCETDKWQLEKSGRYYFERSGSSIIGFIVGAQEMLDNGIRIVGAHTDSPCLKVKPSPEQSRKNYQQLGVEVYGGALFSPWFDRDLSIAGRVTCLNKKGELVNKIIDFKDPVAVIPSLAIHLDRTVNEGRAINPQTQMNPILFQAAKALEFRQVLLDRLLSEPEDQIAEVLDFNLSFYDTQKPAVIGLNKEFIASARLDNLLSCFFGAQALIAAGEQHTTILICNDHEEVGSRSDIGAMGTMLMDLIERLLPNAEARQQVLRRSLMLSVDNAHGIHPNFLDKHDGKHGPIINDGPVIKFDANQSYATASDGSALLRYLARGAANINEIPLQNFVIRSDMRCGSTIGPITASEIGIKTVDIGVATFAMHSIRELCGTKDTKYLWDLISRFLAADGVVF